MLPDWQGRIQFWVEEARTVSGQLALVVTAITSRWFGIGLIGSGIGYLLFVGEPKRAVRHPIWPILGWGVLGVVALAFWTVLVAGYAVVHLPVLTVAPLPGVEPSEPSQVRPASPERSQVGPYQYRNEMSIDQIAKTVKGLSNLFKNAGSLTFVITAHPDSESFRSDFYSLIVAACQSAEIAGNSPCSMENAPDPQREVDVDIPTPKYPGIVIHHEPISPNDQTGLDSMHILGIGSFIVRKSSHIPEGIARLNAHHQPHFYWFELGPGCPWKDDGSGRISCK